MTRQAERSGATRDLIYLVRCGITGSAPEADRIAAMDLDGVFACAQRHMLAAVAACALADAGVRHADFERAAAQSVRRTMRFDAETAAILGRFKEAGIWYMPLKGAVLKDCYPKYGMREMSDRDILFDAARAKDVRAVMEELGFETSHFGIGTHDIYRKSPALTFEMHRSLFQDMHGRQLTDYYRDVENRLLRDRNGGCARHFRPEDFYVYITAHACKHYRSGGTGLRSIADSWVFLRHSEGALDMDYIAGETQKLGIAEFERRIRDLAARLFGGEPMRPEDEELLGFIADSGVHGTQEHRVMGQVDRLGGGGRGRLRYLLQRVFLPMDSVKSSYPFFYRHRLLLPALVVYRLAKGLTVRRGALKSELRILGRRRS